MQWHEKVTEKSLKKALTGNQSVYLGLNFWEKNPLQTNQVSNQNTFLRESF